MENTRHIINELAKNKIPFLFILDYNLNNCHVYPLNSIKQESLLFAINKHTNKSQSAPQKALSKKTLTPKPILFSGYKKQFDKVKFHLTRGDSYLTNLTCETPIETNISLKEIFYLSDAKYRIWFNNEWVVFSPETFVKIQDGKIFSFPMKGTLDASIPNAEKLIMENLKEAAEHATIVDLIRNDLSKVATSVDVDTYRYIDKIKTSQGDLLQVSSQISGVLPEDYRSKIGTILFELLPAGSISGAPKEKTLEIIKQTESYLRGFYTGICGIFDGKNLDSGVMIRFIENRNGKYFFKSGGGITVNSIAEDEYQEMIRKVYLPL
jgi:para-aminobenzoate synthetase component 1